MRLQAQLPLILLSFHSSLQQSAQFSGLSAEDTPNKVSPLPLPRPFSTMCLKFTGFALCTLLESQVLKLRGFSRVIWWFTLLWKQYSLLVPHSTDFSVLARNRVCNRSPSGKTFSLSPLDWINSKASFCSNVLWVKEGKIIHCVHFSFLRDWKDEKEACLVPVFIKI